MSSCGDFHNAREAAPYALGACLVAAAVLLALAEAAGIEDAAGLSPEPHRAEPYLETLIEPFVQQAAPDSIVVCWKTLGRIRPILRYGTDPRLLEAVVSAADIVITKDSPFDWSFPPGVFPTRAMLRNMATAAPASDLVCRAHIKGLKPATQYFYALYDGERLVAGGEEHCFRTSPMPGAAVSVRFAILGNATTAGLAQAEVHAQLCRYVRVQKAPLNFLLYAGEVVARGAEYTFFRPYAEILRQTVCWANGPAQLFSVPTQGEAGGVPSGSREYYAFAYGRVHVVCLSAAEANLAPESKMLTWLKTDLEQARVAGKTDWLIALLPHPPYSKGTVDSDSDKRSAALRQQVVPILEEGGTDLVFCGGSAIYERSGLVCGAFGAASVQHLLDAGDGDPAGAVYRKDAGLHPNQGTVYLVIGNGGAPLGKAASRHPLMRKAVTAHGFGIVCIEDNAITVTALDKDGRMLDTFRIVKGVK